MTLPAPPPAPLARLRRALRAGVLARGAAAALGLAALVAACNGPSAQCENLCERRRDCFESALDVGGCERACQAYADESEGKRNTLEKCDECLSQNDACSDALKRCVADCAAIPSR